MIDLTLRRELTALALLALAPIARLAAGPATADEKDGAPSVTEWSLEDLARLEITSVSRKPEPAFTAQAAIHVITAEDIVRAGATTLAEALRLAPGTQVSRINSNQWAIGVRGFASRLSRSLLVLVDGRSVYTPLFAGVYWEDLLLDDIDRIEVIRGPGGSLWGANAVNGVINIITKPAESSPGNRIRLTAGSEDRFIVSARHGGTAGADGFYRIYAKVFDRDAQFHAAGPDFDDWRQGQAGFRADWELDPGVALTLEGAAYLARNGQQSSITSYDPPYSRVVQSDAEVSAANLLGRYERASGRRGILSAQVYYDRTTRDEASFSETRDTVDVDVQDRLDPWHRHELIVGGNYRISRSDTNGVETVAFVPATRTDQLISGFVHDDVALVGERLKLAMGSKFEHNPYSGFEIQPSASLLWTVRENHVLWTSIARAVRTPSPVDHDLSLTVSLAPDTPLFARALGDPDFDAEELIAAQLGYRARLDRHLLIDVAGFLNLYDHLLSLEPGAALVETGRTVLPYAFSNQLEGRGRGGELVVELDPAPAWRLSGSYSYLDLDLHLKPGSHDTTSRAAEGSAPRHQGFLRASVVPVPAVTLDVFLRAVGALPAQQVPAYATVDLRLAWQPQRRLEVAIVGQNLLEPRHLEFAGASPFATQIQRAVRGDLSVRW